MNIYRYFRRLTLTKTWVNVHLCFLIKHLVHIHRILVMYQVQVSVLQHRQRWQQRRRVRFNRLCMNSQLDQSLLESVREENFGTFSNTKFDLTFPSGFQIWYEKWNRWRWYSISMAFTSTIRTSTKQWTNYISIQSNHHSLFRTTVQSLWTSLGHQSNSCNSNTCACSFYTHRNAYITPAASSSYSTTIT